MNDVTIIGAGPVGLLLACLLGRRGIRVLVLERRTAPIEHSMAIGITPPSLRILERIDLARDFVSQGVPVRECIVHGLSGPLGKVSFREIEDEHRFILSLPQSRTIALLREKSAEFPSVTVRMGVAVTSLRQGDVHCEVGIARDLDAMTERAESRFVVACDGSRSQVREWLGVHTTGRTYPCHFVMGDFIDRSGMNDEAHLFFLPEGSVESFPLPEGRRRWIVQTESFLDSAPRSLISEIVAGRTGILLPVVDQVNQSTFTPRRLNCARYDHGRVLLCGDAAHVMSPIGGQGMNTGFADAEFLADALAGILLRDEAHETLLAAYDHYRQRAASAAIFRAGWGMWLGTWRGHALSALRDLIMRFALFDGPLSRHLGPFYAMLTIPYNTVQRVPLPALQSSAI